MSQGTTIEWTDATWNPVRGCTRISPGCVNCYAERMAARFSGRNPKTREPMWGAGFATSKGIEPRWTGKVALIPDQLDWPLRWRGSKKAKAEGRPSRIFVNSTSDLFHERLSDEDIDKVFAVMALAPQHTFQVLTKRAERMRAYFTADHPAPNVKAWQARVSEAIDVIVPNRTAASVDAKSAVVHHAPLPNVWLGVSVESQEYADERIPHLLNTPAAKRFISAEPLLGPVDLRHFVNVFPVMTTPVSAETGEFGKSKFHWERTQRMSGELLRSELDLVITGGESGPDARPAHPDWFRSLRDQCAAAGVHYFFKQWGEWTPGENVDRTSGIVTVARLTSGRWFFADEDLSRDDGHRDDEPDLYRVGKGEAGHLLDGREHREMPA